MQKINLKIPAQQNNELISYGKTNLYPIQNEQLVSTGLLRIFDTLNSNFCCEFRFLKNDDTYEIFMVYGGAYNGEVGNLNGSVESYVKLVNDGVEAYVSDDLANKILGVI
jgi:hypothetical protein